MANRRYFMPQPTNAEFVQSRERQLPPDLHDTSGNLAGAKEREVARTGLGEPPNFYDVRCVYDSRPVNGYDFNISTQLVAHQLTFVDIVVPNGYRAVPREWTIDFVPIPVANVNDIIFFPQSNGADVPNNSRMIGSGGVVKTFFVVEENAVFNARFQDPGGLITGTAYVQIYGNLLPVTGVALPFEVSNRKA